jgi:hypothetical protein
MQKHHVELTQMGNAAKTHKVVVPLAVSDEMFDQTP